jgi:hypothetical protein
LNNPDKIEKKALSDEDEMFSNQGLDELLKESLLYFQISVVIVLLMLLVTLIHMGWSHALHLSELF